MWIDNAVAVASATKGSSRDDCCDGIRTFFSFSCVSVVVIGEDLKWAAFGKDLLLAQSFGFASG